MLGSLGMPEILFILVLALLVFGPKRLPQVGRTLGKGLREFRRATTDLKRTVEMEINTDDRPAPRPVPPAEPVMTPLAPEPKVAAVAEANVAAEATEAIDGSEAPGATEPADPVPAKGE